MRKTLIALSCALLIVFFAGLLESSAATTALQDLDGKEIFMDANCNMCHPVAAADIQAKVKSERMQGPDLAGVTDRYDADLLTDFMRKEAEIDGKEHKQAFTGSDEELGAMLNWLGSLEAE